jgi:serine/threonine protein kinase
MLTTTSPFSFLTKCSYKYICPVLTSFEDSANMYLVQEYCQRGDVLQMLEDAGGRLREEDAAKQVTALAPVTKPSPRTLRFAVRVWGVSACTWKR